MVFYKSWNAFLKELEAATGIQVFDMRTASKGVDIPYIVCGRTQTVPFYADNKIWYQQCMVDVLLFTYSPSDGKDDPQPVWTDDTFVAEKMVKDYLQSKKINAEVDYSWMMEEQLLQTHYPISITIFNEGEGESDG